VPMQIFYGTGKSMSNQGRLLTKISHLVRDPVVGLKLKCCICCIIFNINFRINVNSMSLLLFFIEISIYKCNTIGFIAHICISVVFGKNRHK